MRIIVPLPADLSPGLHSVRVVHPIAFDPDLPDDTRPEWNPTLAAFVLSPQITSPAPISTPANSTLSLGIVPPVGRIQRAALLVGSKHDLDSAASGRRSAGLNARFSDPCLAAGDYLLGFRSTAPKSPLEVDGSGNFIKPKLTIT